MALALGLVLSLEMEPEMGTELLKDKSWLPQAGKGIVQVKVMVMVKEQQMLG